VVTDFDTFVRESRPGLLARAILYCGHRQNAEDAVADAYLEAYRHWPSLRSPTAWMDVTVRRRLARNSARWWSRRTDLDVAVPARSTVEEEAAATAVLAAIGNLPPRQRQVLVLVCLDGRPYAEVAEILGIRVGTVGATLSAARANLADLLGPGSSLVRGPDPVVAALRATEAWLARGLS
jgi:RNA polymerase sigma factor (sigma-70 family)